jgi:glycosyltransferase involved in cell wall biosynthesis
MPNYSVIIPAYNSANFIEKTLVSVKEQTFPAKEIIVVDDGSSDNTVDVCERFDVRVISRKNGGPAAARNTGIEAAQSEWIAFLDHDDAWHRNKSEIQFELIDNSTDAVFCQKPGLPTRFGFSELFDKNLGGSPSGSIFKKESICAIGMFDDSPEIIGVEDYNLWLRFFLKGFKAKTSIRLFDFTPVDGHYSGNAAKMLKAEIANIRKIGTLAGLTHLNIEHRLRALDQEYLPELVHQRRMICAREVVQRIGFDPMQRAHWAAFLPTHILGCIQSLRRRIGGIE